MSSSNAPFVQLCANMNFIYINDYDVTSDSKIKIMLSEVKIRSVLSKLSSNMFVKEGYFFFYISALKQWFSD